MVAAARARTPNVGCLTATRRLTGRVGGAEGAGGSGCGRHSGTSGKRRLAICASSGSTRTSSGLMTSSFIRLPILQRCGGSLPLARFAWLTRLPMRSGAAGTFYFPRRDDLMISVDLEQALATGHVLAAISALGAGAAVLLIPKGTHTHRVIGTVYVFALVARECGGAVVASRGHLWCIPCAGSRQPGHDRCRALASSPRQEIADGHR